MALQAGSRLGPYEVVSRIGAGGMGEVWLATELRLGRKVALKLLPADLTQDPNRILRFEQEARAASALNHPNVCTIHALGETSDGQHYIAMEYVERETLRQRLATSRLSPREALDIAIQVAAALSVAHTAGIVHRDIKPENVMLRPDGVVKVLDFGLAKLAPVVLDAAPTHLGVNTEAGVVMGTPAYMSPEQTRGEELDVRTDIFSLGVVLYEMATGVLPFRGKTSAMIFERFSTKRHLPRRAYGRSYRQVWMGSSQKLWRRTKTFGINLSESCWWICNAQARHGLGTGARRCLSERGARPWVVGQAKRHGHHGRRPGGPADGRVAGLQSPGRSGIGIGRSDTGNAPDHSSRA